MIRCVSTNETPFATSPTLSSATLVRFLHAILHHHVRGGQCRHQHRRRQGCRGESSVGQRRIGSGQNHPRRPSRGLWRLGRVGVVRGRRRTIGGERHRPVEADVAGVFGGQVGGGEGSQSNGRSNQEPPLLCVGFVEKELTYGQVKSSESGAMKRVPVKQFKSKFTCRNIK